jgi:hypothetical protein
MIANVLIVASMKGRRHSTAAWDNDESLVRVSLSATLS